MTLRPASAFIGHLSTGAGASNAEAYADPNSSLDQIRAVVDAVCDPELGDVTLGDLGMVRGVTVQTVQTVQAVQREQTEASLRNMVVVELVPTFLGCPALSVIERGVHEAVHTVWTGELVIRWNRSTPWDASMVSGGGRERLAKIGIAVGPGARCVRCDGELASIGAVGATACRSIARCSSCFEIVEVLRGPGERYAHV